MDSFQIKFCPVPVAEITVRLILKMEINRTYFSSINNKSVSALFCMVINKIRCLISKNSLAFLKCIGIENGKHNLEICTLILLEEISACLDSLSPGVLSRISVDAS